MYSCNQLISYRGACVCRESRTPETEDHKCRILEKTLKFGLIDKEEYKTAIEICKKEKVFTEQVFQEELLGVITIHDKISPTLEKLIEEFYHSPIFYDQKTKSYNLQTMELLGPLICRATERKEKCDYLKEILRRKYIPYVVLDIYFTVSGILIPTFAKTNTYQAIEFCEIGKDEIIKNLLATLPKKIQHHALLDHIVYSKHIPLFDTSQIRRKIIEELGITYESYYLEKSKDKTGMRPMDNETQNEKTIPTRKQI